MERNGQIWKAILSIVWAKWCSGLSYQAFIRYLISSNIGVVPKRSRCPPDTDWNPKMIALVTMIAYDSCVLRWSGIHLLHSGSWNSWGFGSSAAALGLLALDNGSKLSDSRDVGSEIAIRTITIRIRFIRQKLHEVPVGSWTFSHRKWIRSTWWPMAYLPLLSALILQTWMSWANRPGAANPACTR